MRSERRHRAAGLVIARAVVRDLWGPVESGRVFAQLTIVSGLAPIAAPLLGAQLLRVTDWRGLFVVLAAIGVGLVLGALTLPESLPADRRRSDGLRQTLTMPPLRLNACGGDARPRVSVVGALSGS